MISELLKNSLPTYEITLPLSKKKHRFRPMTVKEEKILLLAQDTKSMKEMANAMCQIIKNCFDIKNPEKLPIADVEKAFLELRAKSAGEKVNFFLKTDKNKIPIILDVTQFELNNFSQEKYEIKINEDMLLIVKYPEFKYLCDMDEHEQDSLKDLFKYCFYELQTKTNVYKKDDVPLEEIDTFFDYMTTNHINLFYDFVKNIPRIKKTIEYVNDEKENKTFTITGIDSFFVYASAT